VYNNKAIEKGDFNMKRIGILFGLAAIGLLASCGNEANTTTEKKDETTTVVPTTSETTTVVPTTTVDETPVSIICPSGTPALGLANYYDSVDGASFEIVNGSDQLVAAFGTKSHDVIVAPVNLGAKFYNTNENYVLAKTFVWGNLFLASKAELTSFEDINNKKLVVFGKKTVCCNKDIETCTMQVKHCAIAHSKGRSCTADRYTEPVKRRQIGHK
jgi:hypothetical protein